MKGVIVAGGLGTRLNPLTRATNKHLLPVYDRPMIHYPITTLVKAGIRDIIIITGGPHAGDFIQVLRNGEGLGVNRLMYAHQEKDNAGIADNLRYAEGFVDGDSICAILGDNCTDADISKEVSEFAHGAHIFLKEVDDPERFGVPTFGGYGKIVDVTEKPLNPASKFAITGVYLYDESLFEKIRTLKPSQRGQLEITDVNRAYLEEGTLDWSRLEGFWCDAGTPESLHRVNRYWAEKAGYVAKEKE